MPTLCGEDYGRVRLFAAQEPVRVLEYAVLKLLPLAVESAELRCQAGGFLFVRGEQETDGDLRVAQAAGGVQPGRQSETHRRCTDPPAQRAGLRQQRPQARPARRVELLEPQADDVSVLSGERHDVRYGPGCDEVRVLLQYPLRPALHCAEQFEGHAHSGEVRVRVTAAGALRVHDGHGLRHGAGAALVVVGYYHVHAEGGGIPRLLGGRYAAVHGDDEARAAGVERVHRGKVQAVALFHPVRDIGAALQALGAEPARDEAGGGDAVHVVISKNGDRFPPLYRKAQPGRGPVHILEEEGVHQKLRPALQEGLRRLRRIQAAAAEYRRQKRRISRADQRLRRLRPARGYVPGTVTHILRRSGRFPFPNKRNNL